MAELKEIYKMDISESLAILKSRETGLTEEEVKERLTIYGENKIEEKEKTGIWRIILDQFTDPLIYILLLAAIVTTVLGELIDTYVIIAVVIVNAIIGFTQEYKAEKAINALMELTAPISRVIRSGKTIETDSRNLVPGDIVLLSSGNRVPADLRLFKTTQLEIDESALTGESLGVKKSVEAISQDNPPISDRTNLALMGTVALSGRGKGIVFATGAGTEIGKISEHVKTLKQAPTPLQIQFTKLGKMIGWIIGILTLITFAIGLLTGIPTEEILLTAIALAVAAIPEGLPVVFTLTLAVGVNRMAKRNAIVRRLPAVETLGSCSIIASDKTGTLTKNQMTVQQIYAGGKKYRLSGVGFEPTGSIYEVTSQETEVITRENKSLLYCLMAGLLANESKLVNDPDKGFMSQGDPTETALIVAAEKGGLTSKNEEKNYIKLDEIPFESEKFYMATLHRLPDAENNIIFLKGAPERVLEMCDTILMDKEDDQHPLDKSAVLEQYYEMGQEGLRVLAMAYKIVEPSVNSMDRATVENNLVFLGLQGMIDPPRSEAISAIRQSQQAGVKIIMVTGDHPVTAFAIAHKLGIAEDSSSPVLTGREIDDMSDDELFERIGNISICARVSPVNKLQIVQQLLRRGEIVAVTGDGVNDAPALKAAHIGVAMGQSGTDVAKETSDMIITDDNFTSIFAAVEEGRVVFSNLRKATAFLLATGTGTIMLILFVLVVGYPLPFLPAQILWLNLVTNGLQDVSLAFEPKEEGILDQPPRDPGEPIVSSLILKRLFLVGLTLLIGTFFTFRWQLQAGMSLEHARTVALTTMVLFQLFHVFNSRSEIQSVFKTPLFTNKFLFYSVVASFGAHLAVLYLAPLQFIFRTTPLNLTQWMVMTTVAASVIIVVEIEKAFHRKARGR